METLLIIIGAFLIFAGFFGSILPFLPGPPLSYLGLLALQLTPQPPFSTRFMIVWLLITGIVLLLDNVIPAYGTKKFGGTPFGVGGSIVGIVIGIFIFPPIGLIVFPLIGAFVGELVAGKSSDQAYRSAIGSFIGFLAGTVLKLIICAVMGYYFFASL